MMGEADFFSTSPPSTTTCAPPTLCCGVARAELLLSPRHRAPRDRGGTTSSCTASFDLHGRAVRPNAVAKRTSIVAKYWALRVMQRSTRPICWWQPHCSSPDASSVAPDGAAETAPGPSTMGAPPMGAAPPPLQRGQVVARCLQACELCRRRGRASGAEPWPAKAKLGTNALGERLPARGSSLAPNLCTVGAHAPPRSKRVQGLRTYVLAERMSFLSSLDNIR